MKIKDPFNIKIYIYYIESFREYDYLVSFLLVNVSLYFYPLRALYHSLIKPNQALRSLFIDLIRTRVKRPTASYTWLTLFCLGRLGFGYMIRVASTPLFTQNIVYHIASKYDPFWLLLKKLRFGIIYTSQHAWTILHICLHHGQNHRQKRRFNRALTVIRYGILYATVCIHYLQRELSFLIWLTY